MSETKRAKRPPMKKAAGRITAPDRPRRRPRKGSPAAIMECFGMLSPEDGDALADAVRELRAEERDAA